MRFDLSLAPPFDPALSLAFWMRHKLEKVDLMDGDTYRRLFARGGHPLLLTAAFGGSVDAPTCRVELAGQTSEADRAWAEDQVRWVVNDGLDLQRFYSAIAESDPRIAELARRFRGLRPAQTPTLFETLVFAIVGQQVNVNFAYMCKSALEERYAQRAVFDGREYYAALAPGDLAGAEVADLRAMKISNAKARAILELAAALRSAPLDRHSFRSAGREQIVKTLTAFRGIGPWTAEYALLRALGRFDGLPAGDVGLQNALKTYYGLERKPTEDEVRAVAARWAPYPGLATFYLWTKLIQDG